MNKKNIEQFQFYFPPSSSRLFLTRFSFPNFLVFLLSIKPPVHKNKMELVEQVWWGINGGDEIGF